MCSRKLGAEEKGIFPDRQDNRWQHHSSQLKQLSPFLVLHRKSQKQKQHAGSSSSKYSVQWGIKTFQNGEIITGLGSKDCLKLPWARGKTTGNTTVLSFGFSQNETTFCFSELSWANCERCHYHSQEGVHVTNNILSPFMVIQV